MTKNGRVLLAALCLLVPLAFAAAAAPPRPKPPAVTASPAAPVTWAEADRLVGEQKYEAASKVVAKLRERARAAKDDAGWAKALVREVQLRVALGGWETAVRFLRDEPWPGDPRAHATVELFYGRTLLDYLGAYSWEIRQREHVDTAGQVDLKKWTSDEIVAEAMRAYARVWDQREALGDAPVESMAGFLQKGNYPPAVRGTLRDLVTYLFVEILADTSHWSPAQGELYRLDVRQLLGPVAASGADEHPLVRAAALLTDLEAWHAGAGRREAALEARLERLRRLHASFTGAEDRALLRADLEARLAKAKDLEWWSVGQALLAEFVRQEDTPDALVRARAIAMEGASVRPQSIGAQQCRAIVVQIDQPAYQVTAMALDAPRRRSIQVDHKELRQLFFRAYAVDLALRLRTSKDYNLLPAWNDIPALLGGRPAAEWRVELPATPDHRMHRTFVTPPLDAPGLYAIVASARADFARNRGDNQLQAVDVIVSDLVLVQRRLGDTIEVTATSGRTGEGVPGAAVELWRLDWQNGHHLATRATSGADGVARLTPPGDSAPYAVFGRHGADVSLGGQEWYSRIPPPSERHAALVYTDRAVYRPGQRVLWKAVAYDGDADGTKFRTAAAGSGITVMLLDANSETVLTTTATANEYGSATGEFTVPPGRLLGQWAVRTSPEGGAGIRVEEYKRPTFEVAMKDPEKELRLNHQAELRGEARYYFGLPVTTGHVRWRVTRQAVRPWWWGWWWDFGRVLDTTARPVAAGEAVLGADGTFPISFTPEADPKASKDVTWTYEVSADVTDEGGETRSASRGFRLGTVTVEARVTDEPGFLRAEQPASLTLTRTDLDGTPRAGSARWTLLALEQPERTLLPADQPLPPAREKDALQTAGDRQRPRFAPEYAPEAVLHAWSEGAAVAHGELAHGAKGDARLTLPPLAAGAYRLAYDTTDAHGATFHLTHDLVVARPQDTPLALPGVLRVEQGTVKVGGTARVLVHSGIAGEPLVLERWRAGRRVEARRLVAGRDASVVELPVTAEDRGGFGWTLVALRDHQLVEQSASVFVPWDDRELKVTFSTFRDRLRPGARETWRVSVTGADEAKTPIATAEVLASMYDRSLDLFARHAPPSALSLYPNRTGVGGIAANLAGQSPQWTDGYFRADETGAVLTPDRLDFWSGYGIGGPGVRGGRMVMMRKAASNAAYAEEGGVEGGVPGGVVGGVVGGVPAPPPPAAPAAQALDAVAATRVGGELKERQDSSSAAAPVPLRSEFAETAFWQPQLLTGANGEATFEFTVPDSVTSWTVWAEAMTQDLRAGSARAEAKSVKELMVRPYLPRFLREGDRAELKVVVDNASDKPLSGELAFDIKDTATDQSVLADFQVDTTRRLTFTAPPGGSANVTVPLTAPRRVGEVAITVSARAGEFSDGERRALPLLPSRLHLIESRFATIKGATSRTLAFPALASTDDPTRKTEQLVVTLDAQLFYGVLNALPYLVDYPYECTEQTLNRFVSTGIVSSLFAKYPSVAKMAKQMAERDTRLEKWNADDPNRRMQLEETPWLQESRGGADPGLPLIKVLDPKIAKATRDDAIATLQKSQTSLGAFPWWPGGPPSPFMTLYVVHGLANAREFGVDVPKDMTKNAFAYLHRHYLDEWVREAMKCDCGWEFITFLGYTLTQYPDDSWTGGVFTAAERQQMLDFSFKHWKQHSPYLKGMLALTLQRRGRAANARLVWDSVMDSAKTDADTGTSWAPEDRAWLWYEDTIETHAFALRTLSELQPTDPRREGLVQWLFLNKKLNHWESTKATAEVLYSLAHYLRQEGQLGIREDATVKVGTETTSFVFEPDQYTGGHQQVVVPGERVDAQHVSGVTVEKTTPGMMFASATWHYATDRLPTDEAGDLFAVSRSYFRRENKGGTWNLVPLTEGAALAPGDEVEVQLSLRAKQGAEYVHLRDPRGAGFEPVTLTSGFRWQTGLGLYEAVRDSGEDFFFEWLPPGEYTFKYRVRAATAGTFRVGPAQVQSMYAPEFAARSAGVVLEVAGER